MSVLCFVILSLFWVFSVESALAVVYVDANGSGVDGTSWNSAYKTLEAAIAVNGDDQEFWIAQGTYLPSATLYPRAGSSFYGGFNGTETTRNSRNIVASPTVIDGQNMLVHIFYMNKDGVRFDGLTIERGNATGVGENIDGGGLFVNRVSAVIESCTFQGNSAGRNGGAIYGFDSDLTILNSKFFGNSANGTGGALWMHLQSPEIRGCAFTGNTAGNMGGAVLLSSSQNALITDSTFVTNSVNTGGGGGISLQWDRVSPFPSSAVVEGCLFQENDGGQVGGGIYSYYFPVTVSQCEFVGNFADNGGGIMLDYKLDGIVDMVERCLFVKNHAAIIGGAIRSYARSMDIKNSIFSSNTAVNSAGAIGFHSGSDDSVNYDPNYSVQLSSCTLYGNEAINWGGAIQNTRVPMLYLNNCILWNNTGGATYWDSNLGSFVASNDVSNNGSSSMTTRYTDMETLDWSHGSVSESHTGSFSLDPLFADPDGADSIAGTSDDNFQLQATSPCIDRADGNYVTACDMDCYPRIDHGGMSNLGIGSPDYADIGALEKIEHPTTQPCSSCSVIPVVPLPPPPPPPSGDMIIPPLLHLLLVN